MERESYLVKNQDLSLEKADNGTSFEPYKLLLAQKEADNKQ